MCVRVYYSDLYKQSWGFKAFEYIEQEKKHFSQIFNLTIVLKAKILN